MDKTGKTYKIPRLKLYKTIFFSRGGTRCDSQSKVFHEFCSVLTLDVPEGKPRQSRKDEVTQKAQNGRDEIQVYGNIAAYSVRIQPVPQVRDRSTFEPEGQQARGHKESEENRRQYDGPPSFPTTGSEYAQQKEGESGLGNPDCNPNDGLAGVCEDDNHRSIPRIRHVVTD